jgi:hypothetical protein
VEFALSPGQFHAAQLIDYSTSTGIKVWNEATAALNFNFSAQANEVNKFCERLNDRAEKQGWKATGADIITIPDASGTNRNLIKEYGRLTFEEIRNHVDGYAANNTRQAQNNFQMYHCIMNSLTDEGQQKILAEQSKYHTGEGNDSRPSGPLLFKLLMQKAIIDTRATASILRENLSSLDTYMATINSNIENFNKYVKTNYEGLRARGERCDDIMINLFKGYMCASDSEFVRYMRQKKDHYDDGNDMTPEELMTLALNKYETLNKQDLWNAKSQEQEQIVALTAELNKIKDANLKLAKSISSGTSNSSGRNSNRRGANNAKKSSNKKGNGNNRRSNDKWAWKKIPPKDDEPQTKTINGQTYHWCDEHPAWVVHPPEKCKVKQRRLQEQEEKKNNKNNGSKQSALANALTSIITDLQDEDAQEE